MVRKLFVIVALLAALPGQAPQAYASGPSVLVSAQATADRYQAPVVFTYTGAVTVTDTAAQVSFHKLGSATQVPVSVTGSGTTTITVTPTGTLFSATTYVASVLPDGDSTADTVQWKTRAAPLHPTLHVKIVTAIAPDAVADIARMLDRQNLLAVPRPSDFVDISSTAPVPHALAEADLKGYQAALVVTDEDVFNQSAAGSTLAWFAANGHGVVLGGQTHWTNGGPNWTAASAVGVAGGGWDRNWSPLQFADPPAVEGGTLRAASVTPHFLTAHLSSFVVHGPGSGVATGVQTTWDEAVLASLQPTAAFTFGANGQSLLAIHWETRDYPGRVVDLGFDPWSTNVLSGGGGYDPTQSPQAAPLIARALWWATDRIPPTNTHFTSKPKSPSMFATVTFSLAGKDADPASQFTMLRFQYKVNRGHWKWARGGSSFVLYHLPPGRSYTVRARGVDFAGNKDAHPAVYRFRLSSGAYG
jgi:hypothetical protein